MTWFTERRLDFIDWCLAKRGHIQRNDLMETFDISTPQASVDLRDFMETYPGAMRYDTSAKRYVSARKVYKSQRSNPLGIVWD